MKFINSQTQSISLDVYGIGGKIGKGKLEGILRVPDQLSSQSIEDGVQIALLETGELKHLLVKARPDEEWQWGGFLYKEMEEEAWSLATSDGREDITLRHFLEEQDWWVEVGDGSYDCPAEELPTIYRYCINGERLPEGYVEAFRYSQITRDFVWLAWDSDVSVDKHVKRTPLKDGLFVRFTTDYDEAANHVLGRLNQAFCDAQEEASTLLSSFERAKGEIFSYRETLKENSSQ